MERRRSIYLGTCLGLVSLFFLSACESKLASLTDAELQDRIYQCQTTTEQSPGFAISCDNYRRECERRREQGRFVC
jgi:hypothetical protein